jgi:hypothetical protein
MLEAKPPFPEIAILYHIHLSFSTGKCDHIKATFFLRNCGTLSYTVNIGFDSGIDPE